MMRPASTAPQTPTSSAWLLTLSRTDPGRFEVRGGTSAEADGLFASVNGWLVDRAALAEALELTVASSDAELVLAGYRQFGLRVFDHLRGSFAVAIVDRERGLWTVARDPVGLHPLFFAERRASYLFASHPRTLVDQPGVSRDLNRLALADHICQRWPEPTETFFTAVRRVMSGTRLHASGGQVRVERYWGSPPEEGDIRWLTTSEAIAFDQRFDRAVGRATEFGPVGVFLSGGLDSISVGAVASDQLRAAGSTPLRALSLAFPDPTCDERSVQARVAGQLGLPFDLIDFHEAAGPQGLLSRALELNRTLGAPVLNHWAPAYLTLARRGFDHGVRTILTGTGGDEWLTLSPYLSADLLSRGDVGSFLRFWSALQKSHPLSAFHLARNIVWKFGLRPLAGRAMYRRSPEAWDRRRAARAIRHDPACLSRDPELRRAQEDRAMRGLTSADPPGGFYLRDMRESLCQALMSWELEEQHDFGEDAGVRFAHPYWDADLVDTLFRSAPALLNADGRSKGLVRQTVARRFPSLGFAQQRKVVATSFLTETLKRELPGVAAAVGPRFQGLGALGIVDADEGPRWVTRLSTGNQRDLHLAWVLLNLESWVRVQTNS